MLVSSDAESWLRNNLNISMKDVDSLVSPGEKGTMGDIRRMQRVNSAKPHMRMRYSDAGTPNNADGLTELQK